MRTPTVRFIVLSIVVSFFLAASNGYAKEGSDNTVFARNFKNAVAGSDKKYVASHVSYPINVYIAGVEQKIYGPDLMEDAYGVIMNPYLYGLITKTSLKKLVKILEIRRGKNGDYLVHKLLFAKDPSDFKYANVGISSAHGLMKVIDALRKGAKQNCAKCVADVMSYPDKVCIGNKWVEIKNRKDFIRLYDQIITPDVKDLMENAWSLGNWMGFPDKGIMLGAGQIWIQSYGEKNSKGFMIWKTKVTALHELSPPACSRK